jgi:Rrf2 family protein
MKLSTKGRYGLRLLMEVALHQHEGPVFMRDVALKQQIPFPYAKLLISHLIAGGILRSARGANGGVTLNKPPEQIKLREILQLFEGKLDLVECIANPGMCKSFRTCAIRDLWVDTQKAIEEVLDTTTLRTLMERQAARAEPIATLLNV